MKAKEMFKKLGYEREVTTSCIRYAKDDDNVFYFDLDEKSFCKCGYYDSPYDDITM